MMVVIVNIFAKLIKTGLIVFLLTQALIIGSSVDVMAAETIKIGILDVMSGPYEWVGRAGVAAVEFAVDEQNDKGGLFGKKIELIIEDTEFKPDVAIRKAKKLILKDKVNMLGVGGGSHIGIAINKVATEYKTLTFNYQGSSGLITGKEFSRYNFRICHTDYPYGSAFAALMATTQYKKFYVISPDYSAGRDSSKNFINEIQKTVPNSQIVGEDYPPLGTKDFGPYVTKIIASKAEAVFTVNFGSDLSLLVTQSRSLGMKAPFLNMFISDPYTLFELKELAIGNFWAHPYSIRVNTPENQQMIKKYHEKHKNDKDYLTWWPYGNLGMAICGWKMVFAGIEKSGSIDTDNIIETLEGFQYKTPVGIWTIRKCDHQAIFPMYGGRIEGGSNPFYNGGIRPDVNFPYQGSKIIAFDAEKVAIPATADYNPRCE